MADLPENDCRVLIVDDHPISADMLAAFVRKAGYPVRCAYSAGDAFDEIVTFDPSVVILDLGLPYVSGEEIAKTLRARVRKQRLLIALSGIRGDEQELRRIGFDYFFRKPAEPQAILEVLAERCAALMGK